MKLLRALFTSSSVILGICTVATLDYKSGYNVSSILLFQFSRLFAIIILCIAFYIISLKLKSRILAIFLYYLCGCSFFLCLYEVRNTIFGYGLCARMQSSIDESALLASIIDKTHSVRQDDFTEWNSIIQYPFYYIPQIDRLVSRNGIVYARFDGLHSPLKVAVTTQSFKDNDILSSLSGNEHKINDFDLNYIKIKKCGRLLMIWEDICR
jgi:hypothetical protein